MCNGIEMIRNPYAADHPVSAKQPAKISPVLSQSIHNKQPGASQEGTSWVLSVNTVCYEQYQIDHWPSIPFAAIHLGC